MKRTKNVELKIESNTFDKINGTILPETNTWIVPIKSRMLNMYRITLKALITE